MSLCLSIKKVLMHIPALGAGILGFLVSATTVNADQLDTVSYSVSTGTLNDSNVFRLPSWVDPQIAIGSPTTSDRIQQTSLGMNIDKKYSNQEVLLNANITNNRYETFSNLNYDGTAYKVAWIWSLGSKLNGTLGADSSQTLNSFEDIHTNTRNLKTLNSQHLNADWWFQSNWHLLAGVVTEDSTSTVTTVNNLSYRTESTEWGLKYFPADSNSIALLSRNIKGNYIDVSPDYVALLDSGYTERQDELQVNWQLTGKSVLSGNMMIVNRDYPLISQREYSAIQRGLNYTWGVTGATQLKVSMNESVAPWFATSSSYFETNSYTISSSWQISSKTDMQISLMRSTSDYRSPVVDNAVIRYDENQSQQIGLGWSPQRSVRFSATYIYSQRTSNYTEYEFTDNSTNLSLQINF